MPSVNYQTYKNLVKQNWIDGGVDASKVAMLSNLRKTLGVSDAEHEQILSELKGAGAPAQGNAQSAPETPTPDTGPSRYHGPGDDEFQSHGYASQPGPYTPKPEPEQPSTVAPVSEIKRVSPGPAVQTPASPDTTAPTTPKPAGAAAPAGGEDSPDKILEQGKDAYRKGEYKKAFDLCDKVLKLKPNHSQALFFKKRAKTKLDEEGESDQPASDGPADPMMAHTKPATVQTPVTGTGSANPRCLSCRDTAVCSWCKGTGVCWMCHGASKCNACKGTGIIDGETCNKCKGSGNCDSCLGSGKCYWCKGSGKCHKCQR